MPSAAHSAQFKQGILKYEGILSTQQERQGKSHNKFQAKAAWQEIEPHQWKAKLQLKAAVVLLLPAELGPNIGERTSLLSALLLLSTMTSTLTNIRETGPCPNKNK